MRTAAWQSLTAAATVMALVLHLSVGCCAHHSHSGEEGCGAAVESHSAHHEDHAPGEPERAPGCNLGRCVFVASFAGPAVELGAVSSAAFLPADGAAIGRAERARRPERPWNWVGWAALRLHLVKQVLLV